MDHSCRLPVGETMGLRRPPPFVSVITMLGNAMVHTLKINTGTLLPKAMVPWFMAHGALIIITMATWIGIHGPPLKTICMLALRRGICEFIIVITFRTISAQAGLKESGNKPGDLALAPKG